MRKKARDWSDMSDSQLATHFGEAIVYLFQENLDTHELPVELQDMYNEVVNRDIYADWWINVAVESEDEPSLYTYPEE